MKKAKVLFFAADPNSAPPHGHGSRLLLDEEVREIHHKVRTARYRDGLDFDTRWAARTDDLLLALNETDPQVVHFSGHGGSGGLVVVGSDVSRPHSVDAGALTRLFKVFRGDIRVVVLNACFSLPQAEAVAEVVGCAIGSRTEISDAAAIIFSSAFYRAVAFGHSVGVAFEQARTALDLEHLRERDRVQLVARPGVDPAELYLISPEDPDEGGKPAGEGREGGNPEAGPRPARGPGKARAAVGGLALIGAVAVALKAGDLVPTPGTEAPPCAWVGAAPASAAPAASSTAGPSGVQSDLHRAKVDYEAGRYAAAFPRFRRLAGSRDPEAMGFVGIMFLHGQGVAAQPDSGIHWLRQAAYDRDLQGMMELASAYQHGVGVKRNLGRAREWYQKAADEKDSAEAMRMLGVLYRDGQNYDPALTRFRDAVKAGSLDARIDAGELYEQGQGTPRDLNEAFCLYRTAAEAGSPRGMFSLGRAYQNGIGVPRDSDRAEEWYRKAAAGGSPEAMRALGELYLDGVGVPRDTARAELWFARAEDAGQRTVDPGLPRDAN